MAGRPNEKTSSTKNDATERSPDARKDSATPRSSDSDTASGESGHTQAGQEAIRGMPPGAHNDEHQSNYGGGGANGGSSNTKH
jgi:hypothetical protein